MASTSDNIYITYVDVDRDLLKVWGQRSRVGATYIERQLLQLFPEFNRSQSPSPTRIHKGMFCFAKYTDDNYYRARVISNVQGDSVGVYFVDYGNKDFINISNIRIQEGAEGEVLAKMAEQAEEYYLSRVKAPSGGWTKEIISEIRRDVCYEEFICHTLPQVGDQKILEIQFQNDMFSNYLVKKQLASHIPLQTQQQIILSYCSLVSNDFKQNNNSREMSKDNIPPPLSVAGSSRPTLRNSYLGSEPRQPNFPINFSQPPPPLGIPPKHMNLQNAVRGGPFRNSGMGDGPPESVNPGFNPLLGNQFNPLYQMKGNLPPLMNSFNNVMIEALAKQIKQYITEDENKTDETIPHHYVNSVLEVGKTYSVFISWIDDGPWSFSIRLLSSESELEKLVSELSSCELVRIKPPVLLGHPCIGLSENGNYCRGVVVSVSHNAVKIYFVDFGNTEDLPVSQIYEIPPKFFKTRVLSQKFSLSGLNKVGYSDDIKAFFSEVVLDKLLMLRVVSLEDDNLPTCELYLKDKNIKRILNEKMREVREVAVKEELPKAGESENVVVTWVVSPQKFYIQLRKKDSELQALKEELSDVNAQGLPTIFSQLCVGFKCVCLYDADGQWYRAVITSLVSDHEITVFYVDYGNTETVGISRLRKIDGPCLINQMNPQAIQCSLKGYENQNFDQNLANKLEALILEKDFKMTVVTSHKDNLCVELFEDGKSIAEILKSASKIEENVNQMQNIETEWKSPPQIQNAQEISPNYDKKNKYPENTEKFNRKDNNKIFRGDKTRDRNNTVRRFSDQKSDKTQPQPKHIQFKRRAEEKGNWRDINAKPMEKFNMSNNFKQNKENSWSERKPFKNQFGGSKENIWNERKPFDNQFKGNKESFRNERKLPDNRQFDGSKSFQPREMTGWGGGDRKKFDPPRVGKSRFDDNKGFGMGGEGRRFDKKPKSWDDPSRDSTAKKFSGDKGDKPFLGKDKNQGDFKSTKKPIKKEDTAPPGSKFEEKSVEIGSSERGIVTYYFSPSEFYVQLLSEENEFKKMMQDIQNYYIDKYSLRDPVQAGDIVIAQFSCDKILYRGEVIKPSPVTVRYVDYGNQEPIGQKCAWAVDKQFLKLPAQVVKCRLSNIRPVGSDWPPPGSQIDKFFESEEYNCSFVSFENGVYEIKMKNAETGKDVAEEIIAAGLGKTAAAELDIPEIDYSLLPSQILRLPVAHVESSNKFYVLLNPESAKIIEESVATFTSVKENTTPLDKSIVKPETSCLSTEDGASWLRGKILETSGDDVVVYLRDRGDKIKVTSDKVTNIPEFLDAIESQAVECSLSTPSSSLNEEEFKSIAEHKEFLVLITEAENNRLKVVLYDEAGKILNCQETSGVSETVEPIANLPIIHQKMSVMVSHLESPKEIYIQRSADFDALQNLYESLLNHYSKEELENVSIDKGTELVAAKSVVYDTWYRGRVTNSEKDEVEIFYIDYGNKESLPRGNVKPLEPSFFTQNAYARKIALDVDFEEALQENFNSMLLELVQDKELLGYFVNRNDEILGEFELGGERVSSLLNLKEKDQFSKFFDKPSRVVKPSVTQKVDSSNNLKVFVSHIDSPKQFWVHKERVIDDLHKFQDQLQASCEKLPDKENVQINETVAAIFSDMWYRAKVTNVDGSFITVQFIDYGNSLDIDLGYEKVKQLPPDLITAPTFATMYSLKGEWQTDAASKFEEIILQHEDPVDVVVLEEGNPSVVDLFQNEESVVEMLEREGVGMPEFFDDVCTVYITHCNSPNDFYVQKESSTEALNTITERLLQAETFEKATSVLENEVYVAKFSEDEAWYRAKVVKKHSNSFEVLFVDYGNTSNVTELKILPSDIVEIPYLAENCALLCGNTCDKWSSSASEKFCEYADGRPLQMKIIASRQKKLLVNLLHDNIDIREELEALSEPDGRSEVYVSYAASPLDFYIQYVDDEDYKLISEKFQSNEEYEDLEDKTPGTLCQACFVEDGLWYRAKILQILEEGCEVFFIDFGNTSVSTELKKLPPEIENIPPRALRCSLDLPEKNIQESVKEEFLNLTAGGESVFRARIITPGEINIVSLKLNGRILEETLTLETIHVENVRFPPPGNHHSLPSSLDGETDDNKKSKINNSLDGYSNSVRNETDEEKSVKMAVPDGGSEGFKSDDEKGISETTGSLSIVNATDNELIEEIQDSITDIGEGNHRQTDNETEEGNSENSAEIKTENNLDDKNILETDNKEINLNKKSKVDKIVPGSVSRGESDQTISESSSASYSKISHTEKLVPGDLSRGLPIENTSNGEEITQGDTSNPVSQNASSSPELSKKDSLKSYVKLDKGDRLVPGSISTGNSTDCPPEAQKISPSDKIVPGSVNGSGTNH